MAATTGSNPKSCMFFNFLIFLIGIVSLYFHYLFLREKRKKVLTDFYCFVNSSLKFAKLKNGILLSKSHKTVATYFPKKID
jgi:hypothetical protein